MSQKITKRVVDGLEAGACVWDSEVKGFGIRVRASGARYYGLKTRIEGRQRWVTIGRHGSPWTAEAARSEALRLLGQKAAGHDPAAERDRHKGVSTIKELGNRFLAEYVVHACKPRTQEEYERAVRQSIEPSLGQQKVTDVTRADINRFHHKLRDKPYAANRALAVLSKMMSLAEEWGLRPEGSNPCRSVRKYKEKKHERYLSREELARLGRTLEQAEEAGSEGPFVVGAIRLLVLTGARLSEILTLQWSHVDLENGVLRLPDSKTGAKFVHLNGAAVLVLSQLPRMADNRFVIAGSKEGARLVNLQKPWRRIRALADLPDVRIHDLRHSFASVAAGAGLSLPVIGALLGHSQAATTARYAHLASNPLREANETIGKEITKQMAIKRP